MPTFFSELAALEKKGLENVHDRIFISDRCQIDFDLHTAVDGLEEVELGSKRIGTTRRGIGPTYSTKAARTGVRLSEVFSQDKFEDKLRSLAAGYKKRYGDLLQYEVEDEIARFKVRPPFCFRGGHRVQRVTGMILGHCSRRTTESGYENTASMLPRSWQMYRRRISRFWWKGRMR